jgi:hypothetical protein
MATSLINTTPADTYVSLLKLGDNSALTSTLKVVSDGAGNDTLLFVSTTALAIGTSTAGVNRFTIRGAGTTSANTALRVENSAGSPALRITDDLAVTIGASLTFASGNVIQNTAHRLVATTGGIAVNNDYSNPAANTMLHVKGIGATSATTALRVENSAGTAALAILDSGAANFSGITTFNNNTSFRGANDTSSSLNVRFVVPGATKTFTINSDYGLTNEPTALLEVQSTTKGFLPPKMTTTEKNAISSPAAGLVVYDTTTNKLCCYDGSTWNDLF